MSFSSTSQSSVGGSLLSWSKASLLLLLPLLAMNQINSCGSTTQPPAWSAVPVITLTAGGQTTLDLDDYVSDPDTVDSDLTLQASGGGTATVSTSIDSATHVLTLSAATGYSGGIQLELAASDPEGNSASTTTDIKVSAPVSSLTFVSPSDGGTVSNPVTFKSSSSSSSEVIWVEYSTLWNGSSYSLGISSDAAGQFPVTYSFSTTGARQVTAQGFNAAGTPTSAVTISITVNPSSPGSFVSFISPTDGGTYTPSVWFKATASSDVQKVKYYSVYNSTPYLLGESTDAAGQYAVSYTFSNGGSRQVSAEGYNSANVKVASKTILINVSAATQTSSKSGLGAWLWYIEGTGYTHAQLASKLEELGVKRLYIKVADGTDIWPEATDSSVPQTYQSAGIEAWAWSYNYPNNASTQANALYNAAKTGYDGYVLDLESEFDNQSSSLNSLLSAFYNARQSAVSQGYILSASAFPMYVTTWGNPADHHMRIDVMDPYVDGYMPQTYLEVWGSSYMSNATYWVNEGTAEYVSLGATKPIHHIVSSETGEISASVINEVFTASGPESSIWRVPGGGTPTSIWNTWAAVNWAMYDTDEAGLSFVSPLEGGVYVNGIWFKVTGAAEVKKVKYYSGSYYLGESTDTANSYPVKYTFNTLGLRTVTAYGYDASGIQLGTRSVTFTVADSSTSASVVQGVPYYFQYDNAINPSGSCQNTSLAMLLTFYGCKVTPDTISAAWGTSYAQSPAGLATVFNSYASSCKIQQRLIAHTDGTPDDVNALIKAGKPVIVHGYFTSSGHVLILEGYDGTHYTSNDPAGKWKQTFKGGYYSSTSTDGKYIQYGKDPVVQAIYTLDGYTPYPIWYHEVTP